MQFFSEFPTFLFLLLSIAQHFITLGFYYCFLFGENANSLELLDDYYHWSFQPTRTNMTTIEPFLLDSTTSVEEGVTLSATTPREDKNHSGRNNIRNLKKFRMTARFLTIEPDYNFTSTSKPSMVLAKTSSEYTQIYLASSFYCACLMAILCAVGLMGNALSIYVFSRKQMRSSINILLTGLSVSDFFLLLVVVPIFALNPILGRNPPAFLFAFINYMYKYAYPVAMILQTNSVWIFLVITAERFMAVCHPLQVGIYCTEKRSILALITVFTLAVSYNVVRFWEYEIEPCPGPSVPNRSLCASTVISVPYLKQNENYWLWYGTIAYLVTQFLVPCYIIALLNGSVIYTMWQAKRQRAHLTLVEKSEHKTALMMVMIIVIFILCYTLSFVLNFAEAVDPELFFKRETSAMAYLLNDISNTLVVLNSATTFFIYLIFSKRYRSIAKWVPLHWMPGRCLNQLLSERTIADLEYAAVGRKSRYSIVSQNMYQRHLASSLYTGNNEGASSTLCLKGYVKKRRSGSEQIYANSAVASHLGVPPPLISGKVCTQLL